MCQKDVPGFRVKVVFERTWTLTRVQTLWQKSQVGLHTISLPLNYISWKYRLKSYYCYILRFIVNFNSAAHPPCEKKIDPKLCTFMISSRTSFTSLESFSCIFYGWSDPKSFRYAFYIFIFLSMKWNFVILAVDRKGKIVMFQSLIILCKPSVS